MGFLDKAKKLAGQARAKVDQGQKDVNAEQGGGSGTPAATPGVPDAPADKSPTIDPSMPTSPSPEPAKRHGDPLLDDEPGSRQGQPPPTPPSGGQRTSSGDPLAG